MIYTNHHLFSPALSGCHGSGAMAAPTTTRPMPRPCAPTAMPPRPSASMWPGSPGCRPKTSSTSTAKTFAKAATTAAGAAVCRAQYGSPTCTALPLKTLISASARCCSTSRPFRSLIEKNERDFKHAGGIRLHAKPQRIGFIFRAALHVPSLWHHCHGVIGVQPHVWLTIPHACRYFQ